MSATRKLARRTRLNATNRRRVERGIKRWAGAPAVKDTRPRKERRPATVKRRKASRRAEQRKNRALAKARERAA